ncbi:MAG: amino acid permease [Gemmatimonadetes bacterium]|nr:amino acid permease [Gemmatimonadota bacterium]NNM06638.1 amino acid permease [Gemmatimonadota bacterium]
MVVVGGIIGAGIFINPYIVAQRLDSPGWVLSAWVVGGLVAMAGALTFAELGVVHPKAGGHYAYLREAFHPLLGFLYGWALLFMIETGAIAAVSITFAEYTLRLLGREGVNALPLAVAAIVVVGGINALGVKPGSRVLNILVVLKVLALALLIGFGMLMPVSPGEALLGAAGAADRSLDVALEASSSGGGLRLAVFAMGAALVPVMFSFGGWQNVNYVAEEIKNPKRNLPRSLILGTAVVVLIYVLVNWVYLRTLGHGGLAGTLTPAADAARVTMGPMGDRFLALTISVSTFGFLNLTMLAPTRVYYAMARDGVFFSGVSRLHPRFRSPTRAIFLQTGLALVLVFWKDYAQLVDYVVFADWIFFGLAGASLFVFRKRIPLATRPEGTFKTPGYPVIPALFTAVAIYIVVSSIVTDPGGSVLGILLLASGIPAFLFWTSRYGSPSADG